ncbi:hypothetical protein ACET3X_006102 [Alternaria dauci]|uniref:C-x8-C-x5-C-x3-H type zinc finger protein n=1 Tax=Alternaria dauci TaxID=48095 RepID=A0ABR3UHB8_9PLEO
MANYSDYDRLVHQMQTFRASDEAREHFVSEILAKYQALSEELGNLKNDYLSERDIRRNYQRTVEEKQGLVGDYERQLEASSFVLALIDGDGAIFQDALLQAAGGDGGSEAASRLYHAMRNHVASLYNNSGNWPIMVQVYLSLDKLAQKLASVGLLRNPQELRGFAQRFSVNQPLFSVIDVGHGKERADHKIKEMLRTFSENPTCRHIVFGGCHDAGYLLNLEHFKHNTARAGRITLLETTPAYRGFSELVNFKRTRFDDVFRNESLPDYTPPPNGFGAVQSPVQSVAQPQPLSRSVTNENNTPPAFTPRASMVSPSPSATPVSAAAPSESNGDSSWATVGKFGVPETANISIAPTTTATKNNTKKKYAYYNKAGQRLDEPLPPKDPSAAASLEARMKKNGKFCQFQHEPKLTPAELNALRYKTRSLACKNRYCENIDCYLGHQCALERDQGYCSFPENCHLRATHGMDRVRHVRYDKDGNEDYAP